MIRYKNEKSFTKLLAKALVMIMIVSSIITFGPSNVATAAKKPAITNKTNSILVGKKHDLNIKNKVKGAKNTWSTSNKKIATVDKKGVVTGLKKGNVTITCTVTKGKTTYKLTNKIAVRQAATSIAISNKVSALNVGQTYDFNRKITPKSSNDTTTWSSNITKIAKPNKAGKFTALAEGKVTITAKTLSGKTDKAVITVVDEAGTVTTQKELEQLLGSGVASITIKTDANVDFTIPAGDYSNTTLVVDAPNADVTNKGEFKEIEILKIKSNSWYEEAQGNKIIVLSPTVKVVVSKDAKVTIVVEDKVTNFTLVNNGVVEEMAINGKADITITGESKRAIPVVANAKDAKVTTSVLLQIESYEKISLVIRAGAEKTKVNVDSEANIPTITGNVSITIVVGTGNNAVTKTVEGTPAPVLPNPPAGGGGGGSTPEPTTRTVEVKKGSADTYTLPVDYTQLKKVVVKYNSVSYTLNADTLTALKGFLSNTEDTMTKWNNTTSTTKTYDEQTVKVEATDDASTKTVTFVGGLLDGKSYIVNASNGKVSVTNVKAYSITKTNNNRLTITGAPDSLSFVVTY